MSILSEFTFGEIEGVINDNPSLRGFLQGYLAEISLMKILKSVPGVSLVNKIPDKDLQKGDITLMYKGTILTIEVKSVLSSSIKEDNLYDSWGGTVGCKNSDKREILLEDGTQLNTSSIVRGAFDILAISTYAVSEKWDFLFMENRFLPSTSISNSLIKTQFKISPMLTPLLESSILKVLDSALEHKLK